jgi:hypothetical protein
MLGTFSYSGSGANAGAEQTFTLNGLTPGQAYSLRLYIRVWDTEGSGRPADLSFTNGAETAFAPVLEDRPGMVLGGGGGASDQNAYMLVYNYVAAGSELVIRSAVPAGAVIPSGSFHMYALSNEIGGPAIDFKITNITYTAGDPPAVSITFNSSPGKRYGIFASTSMLATGITPGGWVELDDGVESQGDETIYLDETAAGLGPRVFYQVREAP